MYPLLLLLFTLAFLLGSSDAAAAPSAGTISESTIYIIRHAEKTEDGLALSRLGLSRAECIADVCNIVHGPLPAVFDTPHTDILQPGPRYK